MATIIEDALWTVTEEVAEHMVETGLLVKCERTHQGVRDFDLPIYHIACDAPNWFGFGTLAQAISAAEKTLGVDDSVRWTQTMNRLYGEPVIGAEKEEVPQNEREST